MPILAFLEINDMYQDEMQEQVNQVYEIFEEIKTAYSHQPNPEQDNMIFATH